MLPKRYLSLIVYLIVSLGFWFTEPEVTVNHFYSIASLDETNSLGHVEVPSEVEEPIQFSPAPVSEYLGVTRFGTIVTNIGNVITITLRMMSFFFLDIPPPGLH